jgi:hypothetical protein
VLTARRMRIVSVRFWNSAVILNFIVFWAMRGGGAGSWGVITSATFRTFPTFNATVSDIVIAASTPQQMGDVATVHAKHIFDFGTAGQYFYVETNSTTGTLFMSVTTYFPNISVADAQKMLDPWLNDTAALGAGIQVLQKESKIINDILFNADDSDGVNVVLGSRLMPTEVYQSQPDAIGAMYTKILTDAGPNGK